jgi:flotillin
MEKVVFIAAIVALCILLLPGMFARLFRKAGPHKALVVYGLRGTRIIKGRDTLIFPMIETARDLFRFIAQRKRPRDRGWEGSGSDVL